MIIKKEFIWEWILKLSLLALEMNDSEVNVGGSSLYIVVWPSVVT